MKLGIGALSDYGSGSSMNSLAQPSSWGSQELEWEQAPASRPAGRPLSSSFLDQVMGRCSIEDAMKEFRMNGSDSPYNPSDDTWTSKQDGLSGMGPSNIYLRQKSWPAPEQTPSAPMPPSRQLPPSVPLTPSVPLPPSAPWQAQTSTSTASLYSNTALYGTAMLEKVPEPLNTSTPIPFDRKDQLTEEQRRVLSTLPWDVVFSLLRDLQRARQPLSRRKLSPAEECRFCKNNGERESYYRSHSLRDRCGRVTCPVLRAYVCSRCGANGERAHTAKYCPLASADERMKSAAMMRSVRMTSDRRRSRALSPDFADHYVTFGETPASVLQDNAICGQRFETPLDPLWAELEAKLML